MSSQGRQPEQARPVTLKANGCLGTSAVLQGASNWRARLREATAVICPQVGRYQWSWIHCDRSDEERMRPSVCCWERAGCFLEKSSSLTEFKLLIFVSTSWVSRSFSFQSVSGSGHLSVQCIFISLVCHSVYPFVHLYACFLILCELALQWPMLVWLTHHAIEY